MGSKPQSGRIHAARLHAPRPPLKRSFLRISPATFKQGRAAPGFPVFNPSCNTPQGCSYQSEQRCAFRRGRCHLVPVFLLLCSRARRLVPGGRTASRPARRAEWRVAGLWRGQGWHEVLAARPNQPRQLRQSQGGLAVEDADAFPSKRTPDGGEGPRPFRPSSSSSRRKRRICTARRTGRLRRTSRRRR